MDGAILGHFAGPDELSQKSIHAFEIKQLPLQIGVVRTTGGDGRGKERSEAAALTMGGLGRIGLVIQLALLIQRLLELVDPLKGLVFPDKIALGAMVAFDLGLIGGAVRAAEDMA